MMKNILEDVRRLEQEYRLRQSIDYSKPLHDMEARLGMASSARPGCVSSHHRISLRWLAAAAVLLLLVSNVATYILSHKAAAEDVKMEQVASRGEESHVRLADGTEVWLNSESLLEYDESFGKEERRVRLTGEAYFKVAKDEHKPFFVEAGDQIIRVVGTEFNVCAYADDPVVCTTLVTGRITTRSKSANGSELVVTPGSQVVYNRQDKSMSVCEVDAEKVAGWREGVFVFDGTCLEAIMHTLSHSYDFTYEFVDDAAARTEIVGRIDRTMPFDQVVKMLECTGGIDLIVKGKHIIIRSKK